MTVPDLIQLMRLSGTDKVRVYLERTAKRASRGDSISAEFLEQLEIMFLQCKREDISEAWPPVLQPDANLNEAFRCPSQSAEKS